MVAVATFRVTVVVVPESERVDVMLVPPDILSVSPVSNEVVLGVPALSETVKLETTVSKERFPEPSVFKN